jgi:hypothetical protein
VDDGEKRAGQERSGLKRSIDEKVRGMCRADLLWNHKCNGARFSIFIAASTPILGIMEEPHLRYLTSTKLQIDVASVKELDQVGELSKMNMRFGDLGVNSRPIGASETDNPLAT